MDTLFDLPKAPRIKRMRVVDAGQGCIQFICQHCAYNTGWIKDEKTVTENKRGLPCPRCNSSSRAT